MLRFIGRINGSCIDAAVYLDDEQVSIEPIRLTLDQWQRLRSLGVEESPIWAATPQEYEESTGETA